MSGQTSSNSRLFWASFIALVTTAFSFMLRVQLMPVWEEAYALDKTQAGTIFGAGFWPFGVSIVLFSLVLDKVGYGKAMAFAAVCHTAFAVMTILADGFWMLYWASVIGALGAGAVEAVINPLIATIYAKDKTKWLNILHAGWPGGLVVTGVLVLGVGDAMSWQVKVGMILVPTAIYSFMMLGMRFPVSERVAAGVSYRAMLAEVGWAGAFIVAALIVMEISTNVLDVAALKDTWVQLGIAAGIAALYGFYARSFGRPMFVFLLLVMLLLATTELGTDSWVKDLLGPAINDSMGIDSGWVLVYTAAIMMTLRFLCGPLVEALQPLGVLIVSALLAATGIFWLSAIGGGDTGAVVIIIAATVYGIGQTFFWPTTLGFVSEQFPRGGAMTINVIAGVGMLGVGILGNVWLGNVQDTSVVAALEEQSPALVERYVEDRPASLFGEYRALSEAAGGASGPDAEALAAATTTGKMEALRKVVILPVLMLAAYLGLLFWFKARGGYRPAELVEEQAST